MEFIFDFVEIACYLWGCVSGVGFLSVRGLFLLKEREFVLEEYRCKFLILNLKVLNLKVLDLKVAIK